MKYLLSPRLASAFIFSTIFLSTISFASSNQDLSPARGMQLAIVKGGAMKRLLQQPFDNYSLMVFDGNKLVPIAYQFDDLNQRGFPYVPGGNLPVEGRENIIEENDELVFMLRDCGEKATPEAINNVVGKVTMEIELKDQAMQRYAYVVEGNSSRSDKHYTHYDRESGLITTDHYTLETDPDNIFVWSDLMYEGYEADKTILDTMKIRINARVGFIKTSLSNRLIPNEVIAVKNGPVRSLIAVDATIALFGVELANAGANVTVTSQTLQFPVFVKIPKAANVLSDFNIDVSLDFHEIDGVKVRSGAGAREPLIAGKEGEKRGTQPEQLKLTTEDAWLTGTTEQGWDIIAFFVGSEGFNPDLDVLYLDEGRGDDSDGPERFKGSHPQVGYIVNDLPVGQEIVVGIDLFFDDQFWADGNLERSVEELKKPIPVNINII